MGRVAEDSGRLFEAGFMLGVVRALSTLPTPPPMLAEYQRQRAAYRIPAVVEEFVHALPGEADRESARVLARYHLFKGHVSGYTFLQEYLDALTGRGENERARERARKGLAVCYWQCSLQGANRLGMPDLQAEATERAMWLAQAGADESALTFGDRGRGGFLNADLLLLLRTRSGIYDLLAVDVAAFGPGPQIQDPDLLVGSELLRLLAGDVIYLAEKGAFARLAIETGAATGPLFTPHLARYFTAFSYDDKESAKLIQAASYAATFRDFARRTGLLGSADPMTYHVAGYSGRGVNSMVLQAEQEGILDACAQIYRAGRRYSAGEETAPLTDLDARDQARHDLYRLIARNAAQLFGGGREFLQRLELAVREGQAVEHQEVLTRFANTKDLRTEHASAVHAALESGRPFVFLTGNPGIGKTTAIAEYLKQQSDNGGYLFFYASPRKVVNRDIFAKFREPDGTFYSSGFFGLTASATLIQDAGPGMAVEYAGAPDRVPAAKRGVAFFDEAQVAELRRKPRTQGQSRLVAAAEDTIRDTGARAAGVLQSICTAIGAALDIQRPNALTATVAIQSLKRGKERGDTLDHLREMFAFAYNQKTGRLIPERMRQLATTTRRIIFMIDEVTGDAAGYEFLRRVAEFCQEYDLAQYGFQVTIVVADASITGIEVVRQHLNLSQLEPDTRKIYLTLDSAPTGPEPPVSVLPFSFQDSDDAYLVNSSSFPARALHLHYKVRAPVRPLPSAVDSNERRTLLAPQALDDDVNSDLVHDLCALFAADPEGQEQAIVYVQNKNRLAAIIAAVTRYQEAAGRSFIEGIHYMQIHADISEADRATIEDEATRAQFAVFFVTSSASRGLTFAKARYIFVDVPRFQVESNLMEILQVIYRGRGGANDDREKTIMFYLADTILTHGESSAWQVREGVLRLMAMLVLLKLCLLTRIQGSAQLHDQQISLIPIGGKSVSGGGRAYHHAMENLAHALQKEMRGAQTNNPHLKRIQTAVHRLMERAEIRLPPSPDSYLTLYQEATPARLDAWITSDEPIQPAYVHGSLLVVPIAGGETETVHQMGLAEAVSFAVDKATRDAIWAVMRNPQQYAPGLHDGVKELDRLVAELERVATSQRLEQRGALQQGYYVLPLAIFVAKEAIARYCTEQTSEETGRSLKQNLLDYVRQSYPVDTALPISWSYKGFPFLVITSQDLPALRAKTFRTGHTLMSREMNLLTMLLAYES